MHHHCVILSHNTLCYIDFGTLIKATRVEEEEESVTDIVEGQMDNRDNIQYILEIQQTVFVPITQHST